MLISPAYAQAAPGGGGGDLFVSIMPLLLIFVVFYFLLIRPQQQKARAHREMIEALKKGDQVMTAGGIFGRVARVDADGTLAVEIAPNVQVKVARATVSELLTKPPPAAAVRPAGNDNAGKAGAAAGLGGLFGRFLNRK